MLESDFRSALAGFTRDENLVDQYWAEITKSYSAGSRQYHNLLHLENLYRELNVVREQVQEWKLLVFSIAYHDIVYNTLRQDNEERSAVLAVKRLQQAGLPALESEVVKQHILATKGHSISGNNDTNLFTDADLSILGAAPSVYNTYAKQIRKEYRLYPDLVYQPGRIRVLKHFLDMNRIFKTQYFFDKYEEAARQNMQDELRELD